MSAETSPPPVQARLLTHEAGVSVAEHNHPCGQIGVVLRGTMLVETEGGRWLAPAGRAVWLPPGLAHGARYSEASQLVLVQLAPDYAGSLPVYAAGVKVSALMRELALALLEQQPDEPVDEAMLMARLLAKEIGRKQDGSGLFLAYGKDARLRRAVAALLAEPGSGMTLNELAAKAGASPRTLARLFEAETCMGFSRWREHLRINLAVDRLARGQSITRTALEMGYQSPASFSTMFSRLLGLPPSQFVKQMTGEAHQGR